MVMDRDYRIVRHNNAFADVFGESEGKLCYQVYKDREEPCPECAARDTFDDGKQRIMEESGTDRNGQTIFYLAQLTPLRSRGNGVSHIAAITTDLTITKRLQQEYQTLFEKVPCYVTVLNRDRRVVKANEMFRRTFGEPRGEHCYRLFKQRQRECEDCPAVNTFDNGESCTSRHVGTAKDGRETHYIVSTAPLLRADGEVTHVIEMCLDITQLTHLEDELQEATVIRRALVENSLDAIVVVDEKLRVVLINRAAELLWGVDRQKVTGRRVPRHMLHPALRDRRDPAESTVLLRDTTIKNIHGEEIPVQLAGMTLRAGDRMLGGAVIAQDLRRLKELEREKLTAERLAAVGQTVAGLAHGLKNVVMGLEGGMYAFQTGMAKGDNERMLQGWKILEENVPRITLFVKEFLGFARGRQPDVKLADPNRVVRQVVDMFREKANQIGIELKSELQKEIPYALMDPDGIHTCLSNLVSNALDACEMSDREERVVTVRTREDEERGVLQIEVSDNGVGIDCDIKKKVFTNFFSTKGLGKGTGLGLLTTRKIVQEHGGRVSFESTEGEGSIFRLEFPRDRLPKLSSERSAE